MKDDVRFGVNKVSNTACMDCSLQRLCIPAKVDKKELHKLIKLIETRGTLQKGEYIFRQGDYFSSIYAVRSGYIKCHTEDEEGVERILGFYMPGDLFGLESINSDSYLCSAQVLDTAIACKLPFWQLSQICSELPGLQNQLLRFISRELASAGMLSVRQSVESRLAAFLLTWGNRLALRGYSKSHFTLPMSRQEIASYTSLAPETVTRCLARFIEANWIEVSQRDIKLKDMEALTGLCAHQGL